MLARVSLEGVWGQFALGLILGVLWSPCVGPTLGAAVTLASQGRGIGQVALLMALFGIGAAIPLLALGLVSRGAMAKTRGRMLAAGKIGKRALGVTMLLLGMLVLSGTDKLIETWALDAAPDALVRLTTSIHGGPAIRRRLGRPPCGHAKQ